MKRNVNGDHLLAQVTKNKYLGNYTPEDLVPLRGSMCPREMFLRREARAHLVRMAGAAGKQGVKLFVVSAYRSFEYQKKLFQDYADRSGEEEAGRFSAKPGHSEHQLGTAVDFGGTELDFTPQFDSTGAGRWLAGNAHRFGFVMSYPPDKEHITGYIYEPWHYRYIGIQHAGQWKKSALTLHEYCRTGGAQMRVSNPLI